MTHLNQTLKNSFARTFELYRDLVTSLDEAKLNAKLPNLPSNTIGLQLWCVIGARESYSQAITANEWAGFSCSLQKPHNKEDVLIALSSSEKMIEKVLLEIDNYTEVQNQLVMDLLEHECQHHGQLYEYDGR